jgi:MFS family permease
MPGFWEQDMKASTLKPDVVIALLCGLYFVLYIDRTNIATAASAIKSELGLSNVELGLAFSGFSYAYLTFQVIGGWLGDRYGPRTVLAIFAIVFSAATVMTGFIGGLVSLFLARVLLGIGEGAAFPVGARAQVLCIPKEKYGFSQGITHSFSRLGNAVTPPLIAALIILTSWRTSFVIVGLASFVWVGVWLWVYRDPSSEDISAQSGNASTGSHGRSIPWWPLFLRMLPVILVDFCFAWSTWTYLNWLPSFFQNNFHLNLKDSALFTGGTFLVGVVGNTLGGMISDGILRRTGSILKARRNVMAVALFAAGAFLVPLLVFRDQLVVTACLVTALFCTEMMVGALWSVPMHIAPRYAGIASGMMNCGYGVAGIISPIVFGFVVDRSGDWQLPFAFSVGLLFVGSVLTFWMRPNEPFVDPREAAVADEAVALSESAESMQGAS